LVGLHPEHLRLLVEPVAAGDADMCIGLFRGGRSWTDLWQKLVPYISGQRALRRELFLSVPRVRDARSGAEVALTHHARIHGWRVARVPLVGMTHVMKEEKMGALRGVGARARMYWEIASYVSSERCRRGAQDVARLARRLVGADRR